ncbi:hypothetical protein GC089_16395 [Cellulomonas sp. JZ18]|uniref:hypothetical protein n=1 Tax=Cellulomonas sp. JZ18 TaxID=2654191 RepID=UPI0012D3F92A|nr:hypothetical protein [Cellulomonas sp. JZ18]QGQ20477.1 hypothetical protein GC089_16395 [Cellulomonas sp. JZ18]
MDDAATARQRLAAAETREQLVDALWDLRDSAYDHPEEWDAFTAETFFQCLAEELGEVPDAGGAVPTDVLARAVGRACADARTYEDRSSRRHAGGHGPRCCAEPPVTGG